MVGKNYILTLLTMPVRCRPSGSSVSFLSCPLRHSPSLQPPSRPLTFSLVFLFPGCSVCSIFFPIYPTFLCRTFLNHLNFYSTSSPNQTYNGNLRNPDRYLISTLLWHGFNANMFSHYR